MYNRELKSTKHKLIFFEKINKFLARLLKRKNKSTNYKRKREQYYRSYIIKS